ncbi:pyrroline-5-carboxylate reductase [Pseudalkalibacillus hwajinpoensis]|uniref:pyrroline-5-carboxylate reductase n=1 Tax=Guptibacillus hwajinpoensis TaxID=208199 RepID=UPI001CFEFF1E|nr:pyrroline-5-carboxylate reductase [Pseudalkalibacillus hwajinpoensis]
MLEKPNILFIGAGRMAEAIFSGLNQSDAIGKITISNQSDQTKLAHLKATYKVETGEWQEVLSNHDVVILAMPPAAHPDVLQELSSKVTKHFVITVAAGIGPSILEASLPGLPTAWIMPNTAADIGESMSLFACGEYVKQEHRKVLQTILDAIGESEELSEQQIHDLTAVTGSAPAFVYHFAEALEKSAQSYGLSSEVARKLVVQMIFGSASMLKDGREAGDLRDQVTTPGGATAAGLEVLEKANFTKLLHEAVLAVNDKAAEQAK